jgi:uncharacterized protein YcbK (DUF882 family)
MLPFIAGVAAGAVAVVAINNNKKLRKKVNKSAQKAQEFAQEGYEKTKEFAKDVKETVVEKVDCLKPKKDDKIESTEKTEVIKESGNEQNDK